jgi:UDP-N-acetylglucosamine:LPS N-acetylglucosamine transferase
MKILLVASHGGHLSELKALSKAFEGHEIFWVSYQSPTTTFCQKRFSASSSLLWRLLLLFCGFPGVFLKFRPEVLISTGAEIALPAFLWARLFGCRSLYIECSARVRTASTTGKILQYIANDFWVQWPEAKKAFRRPVEYHGGTL